MAAASTRRVMTKSGSASAEAARAAPGRRSKSSTWARSDATSAWTDQARAGRAASAQHDGDHERGQGQCGERGGHDPFLHGHRPYPLPGGRRPSARPLDQAPDPPQRSLMLLPEGGGLVVLGVQHHVGGVLLHQDARAALGRTASSAPRIGRQPEWASAGRADLPGPDVRGGGPDRGGHGVGLRRHGERDRGLREGEPTLGHPDQLHGLGGRDGGRQRGRVREPMSSLAG